MIYAVIFLGMPLGVYLALVTLPRGRRAALGVAMVAIGCAIAWLLPTGADPATAGLSTALLSLIGGAAVLAGVVQGLRAALIPPGSARWIYPVLAVVAALVAGLPVLKLLGV